MNVPPKAEKIPEMIDIHNDKRVDHYSWLRDPKWPTIENKKIIEYLTNENTFAEHFMDEHKSEYEKIYQELIGRIKLEDSSVPIKKDEYYYYTRLEKDSNYGIYCRKNKSLDAKEEVMLDANELAKNSPYFNLGTLEVSPNHQKILYSVDFTGNERYTIHVKDLTNQTIYPDEILDTLSTVIWNKENNGFFYCKLNEKHRPDKVYFHKIGDPQSKDQLIYLEKDPLFWVYLDQSGSERFAFIVTQSKNENEIFFLDLEKGQIEPQLINQRKENHLYYIDHFENLFFIMTNDRGKNFRLVTTKIEESNSQYWQEFLPHDKDVYLEDFALYQQHLVLTKRINGLPKIFIIKLNSTSTHDTQEKIIQFPDPTYQVSMKYTSFDAPAVRLHYSSLVRPDSVLEYDFNHHQLNTLKVTEIPSGYDPSEYISERIFAHASDGVEIPISIVYKKSLFKQNGTNPLMLYGYGSYGSGVDANFRHSILTVLNRGFVYAIAHIRGGDEMGYHWYEDAKFLKKKNTFHDFIFVAEQLIQNRYTNKGLITIVGRSAGGMLVGVALNEKPELFKAAIADVPFVDVLNTMLDETLPLTPGEFKEWGNPKDPEYYEYIKSYSPYDNVKAQQYPDIYVSAGINDPRVTYWEPAKWVAKIRELKTNDAFIFFHTNMDAGHSGVSGRFEGMKDLTKEYLFILTRYNISV